MGEEQSTQDRELIELLNELRVALPGVQVLFAFLLAVPFTQRFEEVTRPDRVIFTGIVVTTALASACLIAPSAQHRLLWRRHDKERLLRVSNRLAIIGTALLAVSMSGVVWFVVDFVYDGAWAAILTTVVAAVFLVLWYVVPIIFLVVRPARDGGGSDDR